MEAAQQKPIEEPIVSDGQPKDEEKNGQPDEERKTTITEGRSSVTVKQSNLQPWLFIGILIFFGLLLIALIVAYIQKSNGGFTIWTATKITNSQNRLNVHILLTTVCFIFLHGMANIFYRIPLSIGYDTRKFIHFGIQTFVVIFTAVSLFAVVEHKEQLFKLVNAPPPPTVHPPMKQTTQLMTRLMSSNMTTKPSTMMMPKPPTHPVHFYSLHSWFGIVAMVLYFTQYLASLGLLFPNVNAMYKKYVVPIHVFLGTTIFILAVISAATGIYSKAIFSVKKPDPKKGIKGMAYEDLSLPFALLNVSGLTLGVFGVIQVYLTVSKILFVRY